MAGITMATLRDGSKVAGSALHTVTRNIESVRQKNFLAFFDLVEKCKNPSYRFVVNPFADSKAILRKYGLIDENDRVHDDVRNIVINSIQGDGLSIELISPIKKEVTPIKNAELISLNSPYTLAALAVVAVVGGLGIDYLRRSWF
jgi:hypothetical protein